MKKKIQVTLADDHKLFLDGLKLILKESDQIEVIDTAIDAASLFTLLEKNLPDVVVLDIEMPGMDGIKAAYRIQELYPGLKILILSMHREKTRVEEAVKAGVRGYLLKNHSGTELQTAIEKVFDGHSYFPPEVSNVFIESLLGRSKKTAGGSAEFTERELDVLRLTAQGLKSIEIADKLCVAKSTVDSHRRNMITKTGAKNMHEVIKSARDRGLI